MHYISVLTYKNGAPSMYCVAISTTIGPSIMGVHAGYITSMSTTDHVRLVCPCFYRYSCHVDSSCLSFCRFLHLDLFMQDRDAVMLRP